MGVRCRVLAAAIAVTAAQDGHAGQATCSNPGLPAGAAASRELMPGRLTLDLSSTLLPIHSEEVVRELQRMVLYDTRLMLVETRLAAEYAIRPWLAIGGALPYRVIDVDVTHRDPLTGAPVAAPSTIHVRDETLRGLGDGSLALHLARQLGRGYLHVRAGTSLPLGSTVEDPHLLGAIGERHQHIQLGTGTFIPFVAVELQRAFAPVTLAGWALAQLSLYDSARGFRAGDRYSGGVTATASLGLRAWTFGLAAEGHGETAEAWHGVVYREEGNAGRFDLLAGASAAWRPLRELAVTASVRLPVYSRVAGPQLDHGAVASIGVVGAFDLARRPAWRGLDHGAAGRSGSAPALVPVAGRITVFDLWAAWCAPCRELDRRLEAIARAHPDRIAVRKLDVVDRDSAAWARHLAPGGFDLPHIKVFGADGTLLFERSAPPDELARAVERLLE